MPIGTSTNNRASVTLPTDEKTPEASRTIFRIRFISADEAVVVADLLDQLEAAESPELKTPESMRRKRDHLAALAKILVAEIVNAPDGLKVETVANVLTMRELDVLVTMALKAIRLSESDFFGSGSVPPSGGPGSVESAAPASV